MFENVLEKIKHPVTTIIEKSEQEDLKKGGIKLAILSGIMSLLNVITSIMSIISKYSKDSYWYSSYSSSELWDKRWAAIKDAELFGTFFKSWMIFAIVIAIGAGILFIIAKFVKSPKEYPSTLSMVNNTITLYVIGSVVNIILSFIYAPLGLLVSYTVIIYAFFSLINAFRDTLDIESTDSLVLVTTGVLVAVLVIAIVLFSVISGVSLKDITTITSLLNF